MSKPTVLKKTGQPNFKLPAFVGGALFLFFCVITLAALPQTRAANTTIGTGTPESCDTADLGAALSLGGTITFDCGPVPYDFPITSTKTITIDVTIDGTGPGITFDANKGGNQFTGGIFQVNGGVTFTVTNLSLINARSADNGAAIYANDNSSLVVNNTLFNNNISTVPNSYEGGGAIFLGPVASGTINNSQFTYNKAPSGGAINSRDSVSLVISGTTFLGNIATGSDGGAIYSHSPLGGSQPPMTFRLEASKVYSNVASIQGGGLSVSYLNATQSADLKKVDFGGNQADKDTGNRGGGIYIEQGQLSLGESSIHDNAVPNYGGGIFIGRDAIVNPYVTIENTSIGNNKANNTGSHGGGISWTSGTLLLTNVTVGGNTSLNSGGGIYTNSTNSTNPPTSDIILKNSIITGNTSYTDSFFSDCSDRMGNGSHNLQFNPSRVDTQDCSAGVTKVDPKITTLLNLGGPTPAFGLKAGSQAIDAIPAATCAVNIDQRGFPRPYNTNCDIGAFEGVVQPPTLALYFTPATINSGGTTTLTFSVSNGSSPGTIVSNIAFKDDLPANLKVAATPAITKNCAGPLGNPNVIITNSNGTINITGLNLTAGQTCTVSVNVTNTPASTNPITTTVGQVSYFNGVITTANAQATLNIVTDATIVTENMDNGGDGTLSKALADVNTTTILFDLQNGNTIDIPPGTTLTVGAGVKILGSCGIDGPEIIIQGASFQLSGNDTLNGLKIIGPTTPTGTAAVLTNKFNSINHPGNNLFCVSVKA